jgi:phage terminase large subunit-like protein
VSAARESEPRRVQIARQLRDRILAEQARRATNAQREAEVYATHEERRRLLYRLYPDEGPLRRELYPKHIEFFVAGAQHNERAFIGGNRTGKTFCVGYEAVCHLIGWYPEWWVGFRFSRPIVCWAVGEDVKAVRESLQPKLFGPEDAMGTGLVPGASIQAVQRRSGSAGAIDYALLTSSWGGLSRLLLKAYEQDRQSFESTEVDVILFDEEPPFPIYTAGLTRTLSTVPGQPNGRIMCAFTPLEGISSTVLHYLPGGAYPATEALRRQAWGW